MDAAGFFEGAHLIYPRLEPLLLQGDEVAKKYEPLLQVLIFVQPVLVPFRLLIVVWIPHHWCFCPGLHPAPVFSMLALV